jgi:EmrB/QacA subfamily drug resistance transporter
VVVVHAETAPRTASQPLLLLLCCVTQGMVVLDVSVVNVALPSIQRSLDFSTADLSWVVNAYTICFAGFLLLGGRIADLRSPRTVLLGGLALFCGASLLGGLAPDSLALVLARGVQGLGAAVLAPASLSTLTTAFPRPEERTRALGLWGAVGAASGSFGLLVGGLLTELVDWRAILLVNLPIGALVLVLVLRVAPAERPGNHGTRLDIPGAVTISAALVALVFGLVETTSSGWWSATTTLPIAAGVVLLGVFAWVEGRWAEAPLVPLGIFRNRALAMTDLSVLLLGFVMIAMWYFVTLYLQQVLGYSPIEAGLAFLPMTVVMAFCSRTAGSLAHRIGARMVLAGGLVLLAAGMLLFARVPVHGAYLTDVLAPMLVTAVGIGLAFVASAIAGTANVPASQAGLASGLVITARQIGGGLGLAVLATIAASRTAHLTGSLGPRAAQARGFDLAFLVSAPVAFAAAILVLTCVPGRRRGASGPRIQAPSQTRR